MLARKAQAVAREALMERDPIASLDTVMRWHRRLVAQKWDDSRRREPRRPGIMREISACFVRIAVDDAGQGYIRFQGALAHLDHTVGRGTIANGLKTNGIESAPE